MSRPYLTCLSLAAILAATQVTAAPELSIPEGARSSAAALESAIPGLAHQALDQFPNLKSDARRNDRFALELAAGMYAQAAALAEASHARATRSVEADSRAEVSRWMPLWLYAEARELHRAGISPSPLHSVPYSTRRLLASMMRLRSIPVGRSER
jgi:hypothetical protein